MRNLFLFVAAIGLMASCSHNEVYETMEESNEIKFSTLNDKVTKSANDSISNYRIFAKLTGTTGTAAALYIYR